jgi:hypothetical protein
MLATATRRKPFRDLPRVLRAAGRLRDRVRERGELLAHDGGVERLVAVGAEDGRELRRLDLADHHVGVGHGQGPAAAVAGRAGHRAGAVRADAGAGAVEVEDGTPAGGDRVDRHHRRAHPHAGHHRLEGALELAVVERDVGGGAAHVEADDLAEARHGGGARRTDDAAGRPDRMASLPPKLAASVSPRSTA